MYRRTLTDFVSWFGAKKATDTICGKTILDYYSFLMEQVKENAISRSYARDHLVSLKVFVRWAADIDLCTLPKNLSSRNFAITVDPPVIVPFTNDEVKTLLTGATGSIRLYILLMLNCGYCQLDIARLKKCEVDWEKGLISRKRGKTAKSDNVPVVVYRLWDETFALLKEHKSQHPTLVLTTSTGKPLKRESIGDDGKVKRADAIILAYNALCTKLKIKNRKPLNTFRKTGASFLVSDRQFPWCDCMYLGHAPSGIAARHYSAPPQELFDSALKWLGEQFGLPTTR
jgi:integrase